MRIFDLVGNTHRQRTGTRVAVIGSCRVHDPFETLANNGRAVRVWANASSATHSFGEARQIVQFTRGQVDLPMEFRPFVFHPAEVPPSTAADRRILETADVVFVEICDLRQITHDLYFFQTNYFYSEFVSKYGAPLLPWYRAFSQGQPIADDLVDEAMQKLVVRDPVERGMIETVLRRTWLHTCDVDTATGLLGDIMFDRSKLWVFVSHFVVPGVGGAQMKDRSSLIEVLKKAAVANGAVMFDPSVLVEELGREVALEANGRDIYHYSPAILESVADAFLYTAGLIAARPVVVGSKTDSQKSTITAATEFVNETLIKLHQLRVDALGVDESGLYAHYKGLLDSRQLAGEYNWALANLVANLLPEFDRYDVLRAGLGEFAFILAALGLRTAAYEQNEKRFSALVAGLERFTTDDPEMARRLSVGRVGLPDVPQGSRTLAVAHHLIGYTPQQQDQVLEQLSAYDALLLDPRIFLFTRNTEEEREKIVETIRNLGFTRIREFPKLGVVFCQKPNDEIDQSKIGESSSASMTPPAAADPITAAAPATEVRTWTLVGPYERDGDCSWVCALPVEVRLQTDSDGAPYWSRLRLAEDDLELGPGHARHGTIRKAGAGYYSFWSGLLYFSTSDGTDPNINGRSYTFTLVD